MANATTELTYSVPGMSCRHCRSAIEAEVGTVEGVNEVAA